jgi:hypothetical protein
MYVGLMLYRVLAYQKTNTSLQKGGGGGKQKDTQRVHKRIVCKIQHRILLQDIVIIQIMFILSHQQTVIFHGDGR